MEHQYFIINKPYDMVSQFVSSHSVNLLGAIDYKFPEGTHSIGRLDKNSEGLLILTTNKKITKLLFESRQPHKRTYLVLVNNIVSSENLKKLQDGVVFPIKDNIDYKTMPCDVSIVDIPEINYTSTYKLIPQLKYTWLRITLTEGKYHQVRKMVMAIGHKCKRLVRVSIEDLLLGNLEPGEVKEINENDFFSLLKL